MELNIKIIISVAILVFCVNMGIFGNSTKRFFNDNIINIIILLLVTLIYFYFSDASIDYLLDKNTEDKLIAAKQATSGVHVHNPNISVSANVANALGSVGVGAAAGGGMTVAAKIAKTSSLPVSAKLGVVVAGGISAGAIAVGSSAALNVINAIKPSKPSSDSKDFPVKSVEDNFDYENIMALLNSEYVLLILIVYLLICLLVLYIIGIAVINKSSISSLIFFYIILSNIDLISDIIYNIKK